RRWALGFKRQEPAAFLAALLNSQPMGFYAPSQLVQDARRHGVEVRSVDVTVSNWETTVEAGAGERPAVRLGLHMVRGFPEATTKHLVDARTTRPFDSTRDLGYRAGLNRRERRLLAGAGALQALTGHRRNAHWSAAGVERTTEMLADAPIQESLPDLAPPTEGQDLVPDFGSLGSTLGRRPLALRRAKLSRMRLSTAEELRRYPHRSPARAAGIVMG